MHTARCLMANGGALMTAMCMLLTRTRSAPLQHMCCSTAAAMKLSRIQVCFCRLPIFGIIYFLFTMKADDIGKPENGSSTLRTCLCSQSCFSAPLGCNNSSTLLQIRQYLLVMTAGLTASFHMQHRCCFLLNGSACLTMFLLLEAFSQAPMLHLPWSYSSFIKPSLLCS